MARNIVLGEKTKQLIAKLRDTQLLTEKLVIAASGGGEIEQADLIRWFNERPKGDKKNEFLLESLSASLLKDLRDNLSPESQLKKKKANNWSNKIKYWLLAIAGIIFFGCEGFDGITAMLEVFALTPVTILATGVVFSLLAITVFCAFDLVEIAKNLGIKNKNSPQLLDIYLKEIELISTLQQKVIYDLPHCETVEALRDNLAIVKMLQKKHDALEGARKTMENLGSGSALQAAKSITAGVAGIIFFSGGFFAGQTVALSIAELCFTAVASSFPPIVLISLLVGVAAFGVYWYVERPGIENLIAGHVGLDQEKIETFCDKNKIKETTANLMKLEAGYNKTIQRMESTEKLKELIIINAEPSKSKERVFTPVVTDVSAGDHPQTFYNNNKSSGKPGITRSASVGDFRQVITTVQEVITPDLMMVNPAYGSSVM